MLIINTINNKINIKNNRKRNDMIFYICLVAIPLAQFILFYIFVNFNSILLSIKSYDAVTGEYSWVGIKNFERFFIEFKTTTIFKTALKNSLVAYFAKLLLGVSLGLIFSYYIFKKMKGHNLFKIVLFMPSIVSSIVMVAVYKQFLERGIPGIVQVIFNVKIQGFLANPDTLFGTIIFYNLWVGFGTPILLYLGAMNGISDSVLEAAKIDGASDVREFVSIVFPCIYSTFTVFITVGLVLIFTDQLQLYSFYGADTDLVYYTFGYYLYRGVQVGSVIDYPYLATMGVIFTLIITPITFFVRYLLKRFGPSVE